MEYKEIISKVAADNNLSVSFVDKVYRCYWKAIRRYITSLPLKDDLTDDEFLKLRPNVNIPSIGKLYVTSEVYRRKKNNHKAIIERINNKQDNNA